jgi:hypothetical protein
MFRWLVNLTAAGCLLVCMGLAILWGRSQSGADCFGWQQARPGSGPWSHWVYSSRGGFWIGYFPDQHPLGPSARFVWERMPGAAPVHIEKPLFPSRRWLRVGYATAGRPNGPAGICLPYWLVVAVVAAFPAAVVVRRVRARLRARRKGFCRNCGYDLRASPERCPECGTPADPVPTAQNLPDADRMPA